MTDDRSKTLVEVLREHAISIDVLADQKHPEFQDQQAKLVRLFESDEITIKRIEGLVQSIPSANETLASVSGDAKDSQAAAISALAAQNADAYKTILKIVEQSKSEKLHKEALHTVERMAASNNSTLGSVSFNNNAAFKYIAGAVVLGLTLVAGVAVAKYLPSD